MSQISTQHTPGPWCVEDDTDIWMQRHGGPCNEWGHGPRIATTFFVGERIESGSTDYEFPEQIANARLIAAAPDLLAALNRILDRATRVMNGELNVGSFGVAEYDAQVARAAIAKATGDAS